MGEVTQVRIKRWCWPYGHRDEKDNDMPACHSLFYAKWLYRSGRILFRGKKNR